MPIPSSLSSDFSNDFFALSINHEITQTRIEMTLFSHIVNTHDLPHTCVVLQQLLPEVLQSECFNECNLPFEKEAKNTEIGHLFEHILLEYFCLQKMTLGCKSATFSGVTHWNWKKDAYGTFHITVTAGYKDYLIFSRALEKSIMLLEAILSSNQENPIPYLSDKLFILTPGSPAL